MLTVVPTRATRPVRNVARVTFALGLLSLGFSTSAAAGSVVVSFGLLPLAVAAVVYAGYRLSVPAVGTDHLASMAAAIALIGALAVGTVYSPRFVESAARFVPNLLGFVLYCYVLSPLYADAGAPRSAYGDLSRLYIAAGGVIATYFVVHYAVAVIANGVAAVIADRITGGLSSLPWGASNVVASHLVFPILFSFAPDVGTGARTHRTLRVGARVMMLAAVVLTQSRGAMLTIGAGLVALVLVARGRPRRSALAFFLVAAVTALGIAAVTSAAFSDPFTQSALDRYGGNDVRDLNGRTEIWTRFLTAFLASPVFGIGYYASPYELESTGHNVVLTTLVERGLVGFALSVAVLFTAAWSLVRAMRRARDRATLESLVCLAVAGAGSLFHLLFEDANMTQPYMILSWMALALPELALRDVRAGTPAVPSGVAPSATAA